jgi:hypothetical protein
MAPFQHKLAPMMRRLVTSLAVLCALSAAAPAVVSAQSGGTAQEAITDCNDHGTLTAHYSTDTLRTALATMPADVREYTDCYDVIEKQLFTQLGSTSGGSSGSGGSSSGGSVLPTWLVIVIVVLALAALTFGALAIRRRRMESTQGPGSPDAGGTDSPDAGGTGAPDSGEPGPSGQSGPSEPGEAGSGSPGEDGPSEPGAPPGQEGPGEPGGRGPGAGT